MLDLREIRNIQIINISQNKETRRRRFRINGWINRELNNDQLIVSCLEQRINGENELEM